MQLLFYFEGGAEGGDDDDIVWLQGFKRDKLLPVGVLEEPDAPGLQVGIDLGVMDHFAQEEDAAAGVLVDGAEGYLNGVLHAVTKSEVAGEEDVEVTEVEEGRSEIFFHFIRVLPPVLDSRDQGAAIDDGDVKIFHNEW
jgi:hypothetical protein